MAIFSKDELARTYEPQGYADPIDQLHDYNRVQRYIGNHPEAGRTRVGNSLELPPSRVRIWMEGGMPDAVRAVKTAGDHGWLDLDPDTPRGRAFAECLIGVYACGSIDQSWVVAFTPNSPEGDYRLWNALETLDTEPKRRHEDSGQRPTELLPSRDASILGRCLHVADAPQGNKNERVGPLPQWLFEAGRETRLRCAELYVIERGTLYDEKDTVAIQTARRSKAFKKSLGRLFESLLDESVSVGTNVTISAAAARELGFGRGQKLRNSV